MVKHEIRNKNFGHTEIYYAKIREILDANPDLNKSWCEDCGVSLDDDSRVYGWPDKFEKFYCGYCDGYNFKGKEIEYLWSVTIKRLEEEIDRLKQYKINVEGID